MNKLLHIEHLIAKSEKLENLINSDKINNNKDIKNLISELLDDIKNLKETINPML